MSELLAELRGAGIAMGTRYAPVTITDEETNVDHVSVLYRGYTADPAKANRANEIGADVMRCHKEPRAGWEISLRVST